MKISPIKTRFMSFGNNAEQKRRVPTRWGWTEFEGDRLVKKADIMYSKVYTTEYDYTEGQTQPANEKSISGDKLTKYKTFEYNDMGLETRTLEFTPHEGGIFVLEEDIQNEYDENGNLIKTYRNHPTPPIMKRVTTYDSNTAGITEEHSYSWLPNGIGAIYQDTKYQYDEKGRLILKRTLDKEYNLYQIEQYFYDEKNGKLRAVIDEEGKPKILKQYNENGDIVSEAYFDDDGKLESSQEYGYDARGNLVLIKEKNFNNGREETVVISHLKYNENGVRIEEAIEENGFIKEERFFNDQGIISQEIIYTEDGEEGIICIVSNEEFDEEGKPVKYEDYALPSDYEDESMTQEEYDASEDSFLTSTTTYEYDEFGRLAKTNFKNHTTDEQQTREIDYDNLEIHTY